MGPGIKIVQAVDAGKVCAGVAKGVYVLGLHRRSVELDGHDAAEQGRLSHVEAIVQAGRRDAQLHQLLRLKAVDAEDGRRLGRYVGDDVQAAPPCRLQQGAQFPAQRCSVCFGNMQGRKHTAYACVCGLFQ